MGYLYYLQIGDLVNPTMTTTERTVLTLNMRQLLVNVIGMIFHVHGQNLEVEDSDPFASKNKLVSRSAHRTPNFTNPEYFVCLLFEYCFQIKVLN